MNKLKPLFLVWSVILWHGMAAQFNDRGSFHASLGVASGVHGTEYETRFSFAGIEIVSDTTDGAVTVTYPIQLSYGFARAFSLGLIIEPGSYLDSNATRSNGLLVYGIEPRFYIVNKDRFAWMASFQFGGSHLRIEEQGPVIADATYVGTNFGIGSGVAFLFTDHFGLQLHLRYLSTRMPLTSYTQSGTSVALTNYEAELRTKGVALQASLAYKF